MRNIVLCGFMGTGKTSLGKALALKFSLPFLDIDEEIERKTNMSIPRIFLEKGEPFFRDMEEATIKEYGEKEGMIISVGGGALQRESNRDILKRKCFLVCLLASPKAILRRLRDDETRPLLQGEDKLKRIENLLKARFPNYLEADAFLDTSYKSISQCLGYLTRLFLFLSKSGENLNWEKPQDRWVISATEERERILLPLLRDPDVSVRLTSAIRLMKKGISLKGLLRGRNLFLRWLAEGAGNNG